MNSLTIFADPATRGCLMREVRALCAGDLFPACDVEGVRGADLPTMTLTLRRPDTGATLAVSPASSFSAVPGRPSAARTSLNLSTEPLAAWYAEVLGESGADTRIEGSAFTVTARLEVADAVRTWIECDVPVILRALSSDVVAGIDGVSPRATVVRTPYGARLSVTDRWGTTSADLFDGSEGGPGADGYSPSVSLADVDGGVMITVTDASGTETRLVRHGRDLARALPPSMRLRTVSDLFTALRAVLVAAGVGLSEES